MEVKALLAATRHTRADRSSPGMLHSLALICRSVCVVAPKGSPTTAGRRGEDGVGWDGKSREQERKRDGKEQEKDKGQ